MKTIDELHLSDIKPYPWIFSEQDLNNNDQLHGIYFVVEWLMSLPTSILDQMRAYGDNGPKVDVLIFRLTEFKPLHEIEPDMYDPEASRWWESYTFEVIGLSRAHTSECAWADVLRARVSFTSEEQWTMSTRTGIVSRIVSRMFGALKKNNS